MCPQVQGYGPRVHEDVSPLVQGDGPWIDGDGPWVQGDVSPGTERRSCIPG